MYPPDLNVYDISGTGTEASGNGRVALTNEQWITSRAVPAVSDDDSIKDGGTAGAPRYSRRLSDKVLIAFHHACDQADFEVADQLLQN
jgi:hypothetical protein